MKKRFIVFLSVLMLAIACGEAGHEHAEGEAAQTYTCPMHPQIVEKQPTTCPICGMDLVLVSSGGSEKGELMLSESQIALANIQTMPATLSQTNASTILTGRLVLDETQNEVISSRATGRIERLYIKETGQPVRKGQPLYELYSEELLSLQREFLLALEQQKALGKEEPRFASFLEAARKKLLLYGLTEGQISQLAKSGNMEARVTFLSPAAGVVTDIAATEGQYVPEGGVLYRLGDLSKIWVEAELYPQEVKSINRGDAVKVMVQGFGDQPVPAEVTFISPELRQGSQVVLLRAELPNPQGDYLPGMQANVLLPRQGEKAITVPNDAVIRGERGSHVWVQTGEGTFRARRVELGEAGFDSVAVVAGLNGTDRVVTSGAYLLYSEYVLKQGGNPLEESGTALSLAEAADLEQIPTEVYVEAEVADFSQQVTPAFTQQLQQVTAAYLVLKNALVAGNTTVASQGATEMIEALTKTDDKQLKGEALDFWQEKKKFLLLHAEQSLALDALEAKRKNFIYLSTPIIKVAEAFSTPDGLYIQYCPMANNDNGAYWLSAQQEIRNPFYGETMLTCGDIIKKL